MPSEASYVGRYARYPDRTGARQGEGGWRRRGVPCAGTPDRPLVSVLTVSWNSGRTIEQTIRSVMNQDYDGPIEHIVVDGGSTDRTVPILERYDDTLAYWVSEPDAGLYFAMNKALELARGDEILVLNSDDWYAPHCVSALVAAKRDSGADFVSALANYVDRNGRFLRLQPGFPYDAAVHFRMPLRHETMLLSRDLYDRFGPYDTRYYVNADRDLTARMHAAGVTHHDVARPLMFFRDTGVSSTDMAKLYREREQMLARDFPGLPSADVATLARLHTVAPGRLCDIVLAHGDPHLARAARDYARQRARGRAAEWRDHDFSVLDALAETSSPPDTAIPRLRNIATLTTSDHGGAGIGSLRRVEALRRQGLNAEVLCLFRRTDHPHVDQLLPDVPGGRKIPEPELRARWSRQVVVPRNAETGLTAYEMFSRAASLVDFRDNRAVLDRADIVHLHWVVGAFDYDHADELADTPVAWTLADMNAFTGGCHYSQGCDGYTRECRDCPLLAPGSTIAHETWKTKKAAYARIPDLHVICPSQWLADCAASSSLFGDRPVHMIPNALPVDRFRPTNRIIARQKLGLPLEARYVVFGAESLTNRRKGGDILQKSVALLRERDALAGVRGLFFGNASLDLGIPVHAMGHIADEEKLSLVYAAADVFAFPSREDNAPLTIAESLLSGTPAVAFPVGNVAQMIRHRDTGFIAEYEDPVSFADGLEWALQEVDTPAARMRGMRAALHVRAHNDPEVAIARHLSLYRRMLDQGTARPADTAAPVGAVAT